MVGVNFNLGALLGSTDALILLPFLVLAAFLVKLLPALLFRLQFSWRETFSAGFLLSSRLSLIVAASAIGLNMGIISESVNTIIILVAIVTVTAAPLVFNRIVPRTSTATDAAHRGLRRRKGSDSRSQNSCWATTKRSFSSTRMRI